MLIVVIAIGTLGLSPIDVEVRGWTILNAEASCTAERSYEDGTVVTFSIEQDMRDSAITLWNDRSQSISKKDSYQICPVRLGRAGGVQIQRHEN